MENLRIEDLIRVIELQQETLEKQERILRRQERLQDATLQRASEMQSNFAALQKTVEAMSLNLEYVTGATLAPTLDDAWNFLSSNQMSLKGTLRHLADTDASFTRFGDGEFKLMLSAWRNIAFQENSFELISALENVFTHGKHSALIGLPQFMRNDNYLKLWPKVWGHLRTLLDDSTMYGNSHISRPLAFKFMGDAAVDLWRSVWKDKNICVVTGRGSRFELLPALFDGVKTAARIDSTPTNAFSDIDRLVGECHSSTADMFLISLGPAGTILASKLASSGRRALDIGHLSAAYLNIFEGQSSPEHTPHTRSE